jgi:citrate lyase beta subunit
VPEQASWLVGAVYSAALDRAMGFEGQASEMEAAIDQAVREGQFTSDELEQARAVVEDGRRRGTLRWPAVTQ